MLYFAALYCAECKVWLQNAQKAKNTGTPLRVPVNYLFSFCAEIVNLSVSEVFADHSINKLLSVDSDLLETEDLTGALNRNVHILSDRNDFVGLGVVFKDSGAIVISEIVLNAFDNSLNRAAVECFVDIFLGKRSEHSTGVTYIGLIVIVHGFGILLFLKNDGDCSDIAVLFIIVTIDLGSIGEVAALVLFANGEPLHIGAGFFNFGRSFSSFLAGHNAELINEVKQSAYKTFAFGNNAAVGIGGKLLILNLGISGLVGLSLVHNIGINLKNFCSGLGGSCGSIVAALRLSGSVAAALRLSGSIGALLRRSGALL